MVDLPGLRGLLSCAGDPRTRLLVTDDRAYDELAALLADARAGTIRVFSSAVRCTKLVDDQAGWARAETATAMVCTELREVPVPMLPEELALQPVQRLGSDPPGGVPLEAAVACARGADPRIEESEEAFADYLRSLPRAIRLFAALDGGEVVRATSGSGVFGAAANVFFVNTDPDWRRRGVGQAMTAAALHSARERGARRASLEATGAGLRIYSRLGFEELTRVARFTAAEAGR
jgi:GNAT superfamily N-acetyltransferase